MLNVLLFRMCSQHKEKVSVYCETCHLCICHDCVLWETSPHKGHSYVKLEVLLQKRTKICEVEVMPVYMCMYVHVSINAVPQ
jgi:tripartite motif-containing protein 37